MRQSTNMDKPINRRLHDADVRKWREGKVRPVLGNPPHDRLVSRGIGSLRRICDDPFPATSFRQLQRTIPWPAVCVFLGMAESIGPMWSLKSKSKSKTKPWGGAVPPPDGRPLAQVQERAGRITPSSSSAMSSGRLILDRVGRHQSPSPLHRHPQTNMPFSNAWGKEDISTLPGRGHFYFALTVRLRALQVSINLIV
jgi:hypothetical protein